MMRCLRLRENPLGGRQCFLLAPRMSQGSLCPGTKDEDGSLLAPTFLFVVLQQGVHGAPFTKAKRAKTYIQPELGVGGRPTGPSRRPSEAPYLETSTHGKHRQRRF